MICLNKEQVSGKRVQVYGKTYESVCHKAPSCTGCAGSIQAKRAEEENAKRGAICQALPDCTGVIWKEL